MNTGNRRKFYPVFFGLVLILSAAVLILEGAGVPLGHGVSPWRIIVGLLLVGWIIRILIRRKPTDVFFPLAFLLLVFEAPIAHALGKEGDNLIADWVILLSALLLTIGCKSIFSHRGEAGKRIDGEGKIGSSSHYLEASSLNDGTASIHDNLGKVQVYISDPGSYTGGGVITVADNLGAVTLHLPRDWAVVTQTRDNLGKISIPPQDAVGSKSITLVIADNLGHISVVYD